MPKLSDMKDDERPVKILIAGDGGTGKTGSLVALVKAGYRIFLQNYEGAAHLAPLHSYLTAEEQERVIVANLRDDLKLDGNAIWPKKPPTAFTRGMHLLDRWRDGEEDYGSIYDWGPQDVLAIDALTSMGEAAMWHRLFVNGRRGKTQLKRPRDWGQAMEMQQQALEMLRSDNVRCNVVMISHLTLLSGDDSDFDDEDEPAAGQQQAPKPTRRTVDYKRYPSALGRKLPPKIPTMFPTVVEAKVQGAGRTVRRVLRTVPSPEVDVKVPAVGLPESLPIETGLATLFEAVKKGRAA